MMSRSLLGYRRARALVSTPRGRIVGLYGGGVGLIMTVGSLETVASRRGRESCVCVGGGGIRGGKEEHFIEGWGWVPVWREGEGRGRIH